jgi:hypothetical protein
MPPKKQQQNAKTKKAVEDKTFGMKNKNKSAKVQKFVQQVQQQAATGGKSKAVVCISRPEYFNSSCRSTERFHLLITDREAKIEGGTRRKESSRTQEEGRTSRLVQAGSDSSESSIWY